VAVGGAGAVAANGTFDVKLDIHNEGVMDGKVVVQVYFMQELSSRVRFSQMLLGFAKVVVKAGGDSFVVTRSDALR
jgi:hypothetical protein